MSILSALAKAYERLPDTKRPPYGFSAQKIGFLIALNEDGTPAGKPRDLRTISGKKLTPPLMQVPQPVKRTAGIAPNFLWDKTSYVLGVTAGDGKRLSREHEAFLNYHLNALSETEALMQDLKRWQSFSNGGYRNGSQLWPGRRRLKTRMWFSRWKVNV